MTAPPNPRHSVLVVGSGLAGLTTAYLLHNDPQSRYDVTIFEQGTSPSLDSASITLPSSARIDVPMRAYTPIYYPRLQRLYTHLSLTSTAQQFLFTFLCSSGAYFHHPSNLVRVPPKPSAVSWGSYVLQLLALGAVYACFTLCASLRSPREEEDLGGWMRRVRVPRWFATRYVVPLMAAVATAPHAALLRFPAADVAGYKRRSRGGAHLVVAGGVGAVQRRLLAGGVRVVYGCGVTSVQDGGVVRWVEAGGEGEKEGRWGTVVLAVAPDVVGAVYAPLRAAMAQVPTAMVEVVVHTDAALVPPGARENEIFLRSTDAMTEATHHVQDGVFVTTAPLSPPRADAVIARTSFTRVLRSVDSRRVVNRIFSATADSSSGSGGGSSSEKDWRNGDGSVFLVGGWCWDGMVLLEGCVQSAEVVAKALGVVVPWS